MKLQARRVSIAPVLSIVAVMAMSGSGHAQSNPYHLVQNWAQLPQGRAFGSVIAVDVDRQGNVWAFERCGSDTCAESSLAPILKFDPSGKLVSSFGAGVFVYPHGFYVDMDGNIWATDGLAKDGKGLQVFKFNPEGKILLTLGKAGLGGNGPDTFIYPSDVVVARNGDIFVADGHGADTGGRIVKFSRDGKFVKTWGKKGSAPGEFGGLHAIALDSRGRVFVGDRTNSRIEIFDQDGKVLGEWKQFGRPSGLFIDQDDMLYVVDSQSDEKTNPGFQKGIRIGGAKDGIVKSFIPIPGSGDNPMDRAEGVATDNKGNLYGAESNSHNLRKYTK